MGQQLSKTTKLEQSTDHSSLSSGSSDESLKSDSKLFSPENSKRSPKQIKIKTTCFLKTASKTIIETPNTEKTPKKQSLTQVLEKIKLHLTSLQPQSATSEFQKLILEKPLETASTNLDINRIDSFFESVPQNLNSNEFRPNSTQPNKNISIQNWKSSVDKIMSLLLTKFDYCQGQLLICAIMRLYFQEETAYLFMNELLQKIGSLLGCPQELQSFVGKLEIQCEEKFPSLKEKLKTNDLDFQVIYLNWILGVFSTTFSKETCIMIWFKLILSENPQKFLQSIIILCMENIENHISSQISKTKNPEVEEIQLNSRCLTTFIDENKIYDLIK